MLRACLSGIRSGALDSGHASTMTSQFGLTVKELRELMEFRGHEGVDKVAELGGVHEICSKLKTSEAEG